MDTKIGGIELTNQAEKRFTFATSLLCVSTAGRGAVSVEAAPAFFRETRKRRMAFQPVDGPCLPAGRTRKPNTRRKEVRLVEPLSSCLAAPDQNHIDNSGRTNRLKHLISQGFLAIDEAASRRYIICIISPVASVAGREAGSNESASAFSGRAA